ncbi:MAG: GNAT family N-acetyltransferase [Muribaculaceae bacterium]|nr:GNAT family N-acetyltransferase [Muribaculaceae bacterium]
MPALEALYLASFPPEERRPWQDIAAGRGPVLLCIDTPEYTAAGLVTLWRFPQFTYIEHLCTLPALRGRGTGAAVMGALKAGSDTPLLLEAEPPREAGGIEERRIAFYRRCGLEVLPGNYVQPPYGPGLPSVPLLLMSTDAALDPAAAARILHKHVYGCQESN